MHTPVIRTRNLYKRYGRGEAALEDITLDIYDGEIFGVIGKSGAGKSTLIRCMNYLERPTSGDVFFKEQPISGMTRRELYAARQAMGMIFQHFHLLMQRSALDNICFPMEIAGVKRTDAVKRARELLELVKLPEKAAAFPAMLSGGQRQRVAIARALAVRPRVLLCDEATSALDAETTGEILALLRDINERFGITIVVVTHEMRVVEELCRRVAVLDASRVEEIGLVKDVFSNPQSPAARALIQTDGAALSRLARLLAERGLSAEEVLSRV